MFSRKPSPTPRGVPLGELEMALKPTTLKTSREGEVTKSESVFVDEINKLLKNKIEITSLTKKNQS